MNTVGITLVSIVLGMQPIAAENGSTRPPLDASTRSDVDMANVPPDAHPTPGTFRLAGNTACNPRVKICEE